MAAEEKDPKNKFAQWLLELEAFNYDIVYRQEWKMVGWFTESRGREIEKWRTRKNISRVYLRYRGEYDTIIS